MKEPDIGDTEGEPGSTDSHILHKTEVHHLVLDSLVIERARRLDLIRLDAAHVMGLLLQLQKRTLLSIPKYYNSSFIVDHYRHVWVGDSL